jgi:alanine dehydrogenase
MYFGIIRERKNPPDMRVVLSPQACQKVASSFPAARIVVEPSSVRVFTDQEYQEAGITVAAEMEKAYLK